MALLESWIEDEHKKRTGRTIDLGGHIPRLRDRPVATNPRRDPTDTKDDVDSTKSQK